MTSNTAMLTPAASPTAGSEQASFLRWSGWSGLAATAAFVATIVATTGSTAPPESVGEVISYLDEVAEGSASHLYGIAGVVLCLLYVPMAVGVYHLLGRRTLAWFGSGAVVAGLVVLFPAYLVNLIIPAGLASAAAELGDAGADSLYSLHAFASSAAEACFTIGSVLSLAVGPLLWGLAWLRSTTPRRWLGWTAVVTGLTGAVWFVWLSDAAMVLPVLLVNTLLSLVLFTGASASLVAKGRSGQ